MTFVPSPEGSWAPPRGPRTQGSKARPILRHEHTMRIISWTTEGPLKVLMSCPRCSKTEVVVPNKRLRKIPAGFTVESWAKFLEKGEARLASLPPEERAYLKRLAAWLRASAKAA